MAAQASGRSEVLPSWPRTAGGATLVGTTGAGAVLRPGHRLTPSQAAYPEQESYTEPQPFPWRRRYPACRRAAAAFAARIQPQAYTHPAWWVPFGHSLDRRGAPTMPARWHLAYAIHAAPTLLDSPRTTYGEGVHPPLPHLPCVGRATIWASLWVIAPRSA